VLLLVASAQACSSHCLQTFHMSVITLADFMQMDEIEEDVKAIIEPIVDHRKHFHAKAAHISNSSQK
jgi:hypothetical protein